MKKGQLKALFIEAKGTGQKYIGVMIQTEGSSEPEVIINPKENFNAKFDYYMAAYDDDLILIAAKGKKDIRITGAAAGASFEDIQSQLIDHLIRGNRCRTGNQCSCTAGQSDSVRAVVRERILEKVI